VQVRRSAIAAAAGSRVAAVGLGVVACGAALYANLGSERPVRAATPAASPSALNSEVEREIIRNGEAGFVVTDIAYALGPDAEAGACPSGMSGGIRALMDAYKKTGPGMRKDGETLDAYERRLEVSASTSPGGQNMCLHPEVSSPDANWRMVSGRNLKVAGIDLDAGGGEQGDATCAQEDFAGLNGERGVDNQFYRVVGCTTGYQSSGLANSFQIEMHTGSWGILISLKGVDDAQNDPDVEVGIYSNGDPIQLSAARQPLAFATYAVHQDRDHHAKTRGRIQDGILTIDPVDLRLHDTVGGMQGDRVLRAARLRLTWTPDGGMEGYLAGYTPVEDMFNSQFSFRSARELDGTPTPERVRASRSIGRAGALGFTCNGVYHALYQAADGHRDEKTGRCTSISTQYRIRVAPAFVVDAPTQSVNAPLAAG
jgi:hypothetical protein